MGFINQLITGGHPSWIVWRVQYILGKCLDPEAMFHIRGWGLMMQSGRQRKNQQMKNHDT